MFRSRSAVAGRRLLRRGLSRVLAGALRPIRLGWRLVPRHSVHDYFRRGVLPSEVLEIIHPPHRGTYPLPCNISDAAALPADRGWWGYSFRDVPHRLGGATFIATLRDCLVLPLHEPSSGEFFPAILDRRRHALALPQIDLRPFHRAGLRGLQQSRRLPRATWIVERVYDNHSHWLTAHLPKLQLLVGLDRLDGVLLPKRTTPVIDASLAGLGLNAAEFERFDAGVPLRIDALTIVGTDRFRPELLRAVRSALARPVAKPWRRVFISRKGATRRRLLNEGEVWPLLRGAGFERVRMEGLDFEAQVQLMAETQVLLAPHGAGLTNMLFCSAGTQIVELADLSFPNPNFYALAAALGHDYWLVSAAAHGDCHPLDQDLSVSPADLTAVLEAIALRLANRGA